MQCVSLSNGRSYKDDLITSVKHTCRLGAKFPAMWKLSTNPLCRWNHLCWWYVANIGSGCCLSHKGGLLFIGTWSLEGLQGHLKVFKVSWKVSKVTWKVFKVTWRVTRGHMIIRPSWRCPWRPRRVCVPAAWMTSAGLTPGWPACSWSAWTLAGRPALPRQTRRPSPLKEEEDSDVLHYCSWFF